MHFFNMLLKLYSQTECFILFISFRFFVVVCASRRFVCSFVVCLISLATYRVVYFAEKIVVILKSILFLVFSWVVFHCCLSYSPGFLLLYIFRNQQLLKAHSYIIFVYSSSNHRFTVSANFFFVFSSFYSVIYRQLLFNIFLSK